MNELLDNLPNQFDPKIDGRVLIFDGDSLVYKAAATSKRMSTAIRKFQMGVLEQMFITKSETARVHLTHRDSLKAGRGNILAWKPYQGNRDGSKRPPMLEPLRDAVCFDENVLPEFTVSIHKVLEADDACMIDSYAYGESGILSSEDKDLRATPYLFWDTYQGREVRAKGIGSVWEYVTEGGTLNVHGIGRMFFWAQMLMGDGADNIRGLDRYHGTLIGPVGTLEALQGLNDTEDESEVANHVIDAYRASDQNPLPEGYLLHMMRNWEDSFWDVLQALHLTKANRRFIDDCASREWFRE